MNLKMATNTFHPGSAEPQKPQSSRRRESPSRLRRSGSLNLDPDIFKTANFSDPDVGKKLLLKSFAKVRAGQYENKTSDYLSHQTKK